MTAHDGDKQCLTTKPRHARRRILQGIGAGGLAAAASVFGFAKPAYANSNRCCDPECPQGFGFSLQQCMTGSYYVWYCRNPIGSTCACCEHNQPGRYGCGTGAYSVVACSYPG